MTCFKHILIADDDGDDIELFRWAVKTLSTNIEVSFAGDGQKVIELLETDSLPDIIVLDLNMPRMSGYECLKKIRNNCKYNDVPIMILSTSSSQKDMDYCLANGANYYAVKPQSHDGLSKIVDDLCNKIKADMTKNRPYN